MHRTWLLSLVSSLAFVFILTLSSGVLADEREAHDLEEHEKDYTFGYPTSPSDAWITAIGGRLYDNWMNVLDKPKPKATHAAWPASNTKKKGAVTWRCKSCHGWDFKGADGKYAKGSYKTGIKGVLDVKGKDPKKIHVTLLDSTHGYTHDMISEQYMNWLATFLSKGTYDIAPYVADDGTVNGNANKGKQIFQNICAACHGFGGTALNWGTDKEPAYIGTEANANPWEVFAKIRHGHPGVEMVSLAAFTYEDAANVLKYVRTLPVK